MFPSYPEQLKDPRWIALRDRLIEEHNHMCERCNACEEAYLQIHHICYLKGKMAWEYPDHLLRCWCDECHDTFHEDFPMLVVLWADASNRTRRQIMRLLLSTRGANNRPVCMEAIEYLERRRQELIML